MSTCTTDTKITRYYGDIYNPLVWNLEPAFTAKSKVRADLHDIQFQLRSSRSGSPLYSATLLESVGQDPPAIAMQSESSFLVDVLITDFTGLSAEVEYFIGLGLKFTEDASETQFRVVTLQNDQLYFKYNPAN